MAAGFCSMSIAFAKEEYCVLHANIYISQRFIHTVIPLMYVCFVQRIVRIVLTCVQCNMKTQHFPFRRDSTESLKFLLPFDVELK